MVLEEVKRAHEIMYTKLSCIHSNIHGRVVYNNPAFQDFFQIEDGEALGKINGEGRDEIIK